MDASNRPGADVGETCLLGMMLVVHVLLVCYAAAVQAPLVDEPKHLVAGVAHRRLGRFDIYSVNPPLSRIIASLAIDCLGLEVDWARFDPDPLSSCEASIARDFIRKHGVAARRAFTLARWLSLPFTVLGAIVCYLWAKAIFGARAGLISSACWCFCPNMLGFAGVILPDLPAAAMAITAGWRYWFWLRQPTWLTFLLAAFTLGLALLTKTTLILLPIVWCAVWISHRWNRRSPGGKAGPSFVSLVGLFAVALYLLNLGYGFEGSGTPLAEFDFVSPTLTGQPVSRSGIAARGNHFRESWLGAIPMPVPRSFIIGIDLQKRDFDEGLQSYLRGRWAERGWWYYYLYAILIKSPLPVLLLAGIACLERWRNGPSASPGIDDRTTRLILLGPPLTILVTASSQTGFSHHLRYILPAFPFVFVALGSAQSWWHRSRMCRTILLVLLAWLVFEGTSTCPHGVSYFNELVGGSRNGHRHLLHSNCDWGQDLYHLDHWIADHPEARPILIDYYGLTAADSYGGFQGEGVLLEVPSGLRFEALIRNGDPFWVALSVTRLTQGNPAYHCFKRQKPLASVGNSILIFEVSPSTITSVQRQSSIDP